MSIPTGDPPPVNNELPFNRMRSLPLLDLEERQMAEVISGDDLWSPAKAQQNALSSQWSVAIGKPASRSKP